MGLSRLIAPTLALSVAACGADAPEADAAPLLRPDTPGTAEPPPVFAPDDDVVRFDSAGGAFRVHYARRGQHAVPLADGDADGVPDVVHAVASEYEAVLRFFTDVLGFARPLSDAQDGVDDGGDGRFDVYLVDFPTRADGAYRDELCTVAPPRRCAGYMLQENDFDGRGYPSLAIATRVLASHELFHAVQAGYLSGASPVLGEATAVWASEAYDPSLNDFEGFVGGYLARPERSLGQDPTGPVDPFSYGAALFFRFLEETRTRPLVRPLWESLRQRAQAWPLALDAVMREEAGDSLSAAFAEFAAWNLHTGARANPEVSYAEGARYPQVAEKAVGFPFVDDLVRMAPLSARYFVGTVASAEALTARLVSLSNGTDALALRMAVERAGKLLPLDPAAGFARSSVAAQPGDRVHTLIVDARATGPIRRVRLCIGAEAETAASCATP
ncbi:MAG: MXAN_6640 family putative metalloprotease [Polyangiales bacterium]